MKKIETLKKYLTKDNYKNLINNYYENPFLNTVFKIYFDKDIDIINSLVEVLNAMHDLDIKKSKRIEELEKIIHNINHMNN